MAQTNEERWTAWWAKYPGPDTKGAGVSWWAKRPAAYSSEKWYAALDDEERNKLDAAIRYHRGPLSTGTGTAPHKAGQR